MGQGASLSLQPGPLHGITSLPRSTGGEAGPQNLLQPKVSGGRTSAPGPLQCVHTCPTQPPPRTQHAHDKGHLCVVSWGPGCGKGRAPCWPLSGRGPGCPPPLHQPAPPNPPVAAYHTWRKHKRAHARMHAFTRDQTRSPSCQLLAGTWANKASLNSWGAGGGTGHPRGGSGEEQQTPGCPLAAQPRTSHVPPGPTQPGAPRHTQHGPCGHVRTCGGRGQGTGGAFPTPPTGAHPPATSHFGGPPRTPYSRVPEGAGWPPTPTLPSEAQMQFPTSPAHGTEPDLQQTEAAWPRGAEIPGRWHHTPATHRQPGCAAGGERTHRRPPDTQLPRAPGCPGPGPS